MWLFFFFFQLFPPWGGKSLDDVTFFYFMKTCHFNRWHFISTVCETFPTSHLNFWLFFSPPKDILLIVDLWNSWITTHELAWTSSMWYQYRSEYWMNVRRVYGLQALNRHFEVYCWDLCIRICAVSKCSGVVTMQKRSSATSRKSRKNLTREVLQNLQQGLLGELHAWIYSARDTENQPHVCYPHTQVSWRSWCYQVLLAFGLLVLMMS